MKEKKVGGREGRERKREKKASKQATEWQANLFLPTSPPPIAGEPSKGSWDTLDSTVWIAASSCREAVMRNHRPGTPSLITYHHRNSALRQR